MIIILPKMPSKSKPALKSKNASQIFAGLKPTFQKCLELFGQLDRFLFKK
jgi:hypothetical protein